MLCIEEKKFCFSHLLGGGHDQSCENSQNIFFSNECAPKANFIFGHPVYTTDREILWCPLFIVF